MPEKNETTRVGGIYPIGNKNPNLPFHPGIRAGDFLFVSGQVAKGQRLVSSSIKGTARAVASNETINPFHVIGRALEAKTDDGIDLVNCVVRTNN